MNDKTIQTKHKKWTPRTGYFSVYLTDGLFVSSIDFADVAQVALYPEVLKRMAASPEGYRAMVKATSAALRDAIASCEDHPMRPASDELVCEVIREAFAQAGFTNVATEWCIVHGSPALHITWEGGGMFRTVYPHHRGTLGAVQELAREAVIDAKMLRGRCSKTPDQEALESEAKKNYPTLGAPR